MYEATANACTKDALMKARAERSAALRWLVRTVFGGHQTAADFPLGATALTGSSR